MAENTLGRRIQDYGIAYEESGRKGEAPVIKILNKEYPLKARVVKLGGFSAHGDKNEMLRFLKESNLKIKRIAVVHGEEEQTLSFTGFLTQAGYSAFAPRPGDTVEIE
jgi:metallo-beta-lactamase family protein